MTAVFPTIIAVLIGLSFEEFYAETAMPEESLGWLLLALPLCLLPIVAAEVLFLISRRRFDQGRPYDIRPFARYVQALPLPVYALIIFVFGWPKIVVPLGLERSVLFDHLMVLLPYFLLLLCALVEAARLRRPMRLGSSGPVPPGVRDVLGAVADTGRHLGLMLVPLFALILFLDVARDTDLSLYFNNLPLLSSGFLLFSLIGLAVIYPVLFRFGMGLKPLVAGAPLRQRLEELAANLDFRCRDILYWSTRKPVLNAAIIGVVPRFRYVILTEELCKRLTLEELGAVFTHEVGHGKRHHALYYLLFSVAFLTTLVPVGDWMGGLILEWTDGRIDASLGAAISIYLPAFAFYWLILFTYLSRRFELEADVFGVEATSDPGLFITTLEKVARLSRIERFRRAPRHFSIAGRTDFLRRAFIEREPDLLEGFRRKLGLIRSSIVWVSAAVLFLGGIWLLLLSVRGAGVIFLEQRRDDDAISALSAVVKVWPSDMVARALLAEAELYRGDLPPGDPGVDWQILAESASSLDPLQRILVLENLQVGWARAISRGRYEESLTLVGRARHLNHLGQEVGATVFDVDLKQTLAEMASVSTWLGLENAEQIERLATHPPRWLRRPNVSAALESVENWGDDRKSL